MTVDQPKFRRMGEERRRDDLIAAALDLMAEGGPESATVRAIAARAGATPGLIRYYFSTKDDLWRAAYRTHMTRLTEQCRAAIPARLPVRKNASSSLWRNERIMPRFV